jgi:sugar lactone lactonase YvrE
MQSIDEVEIALDARDELGEGALWDHSAGRLISVDIMQGRVHLFDPDSRERKTLSVGQPVGAAVPCRRGGLMLAVRDGFAHLDLESGDLTFVAYVERDAPDRRMNDGSCDAAGRFWAGTMRFDEKPGFGSLYRLDPDGSTHTMLTGVGVSNGIDWCLDGTRMYYVDSLTRRIDEFDFDLHAGSISNRRTFVAIDAADGYPDGLTVDAEGAIWLALWNGSAVRRYLPDGTLDRVLTLPVTHPTTCAFGGKHLTDLYITSAAIALSDGQRRDQPAAGAILRHRPGVAGRPAHAFGG